VTAPDLPISPVVDDLDTGGFFQAAARGHLVVLSCTRCGRDLNPPRRHCRYCGHNETQWRQLSGLGHLISWTVAEAQLHPAFEVPYTILVVEADDAPGVRLLGHLPGAHDDLEPGMPMAVRFDQTPGEVSVPNWEPLP
jgi:uncharacterized OB-fold protein